MPTAREVPASQLLEKVAGHLKANVGDIAPPKWAENAKTGVQRDRTPQNPDWWYMRCAGLMRKLYIHGPIGVQRLRVEYGGRQGRKRGREHSLPAGGSSIREPLQQLEKAGLVKHDGIEGRRLTREGLKLMNRVASEMLKESRTPTKG